MLDPVSVPVGRDLEGAAPRERNVRPALFRGDTALATQLVAPHRSEKQQTGKIMASYSILYAENVAHYGLHEIEAETR